MTLPATRPTGTIATPIQNIGQLPIDQTDDRRRVKPTRMSTTPVQAAGVLPWCAIFAELLAGR